MACVLGCAHAICRRLRTQTFAHCARCVHCAQDVCGWRRTVHRRLQIAMTERECCLLVLNLVSSTLSCSTAMTKVWRRTVHRRLQMAMPEVWLCVSMTCILVQVAADLIQARIRTSRDDAAVGGFVGLTRQTAAPVLRPCHPAPAQTQDDATRDGV